MAFAGGLRHTASVKTTSTLSLALAAVLTVTALAGCGTPSPVETDMVLEVGNGSDGSGPADADSDDSAPAFAVGDPISVGGPVDGILIACDELVEYTPSETEFDVQWRWEFECRDREPFDKTVAGLDGVGWLTHTQSQQLGNESYVTDKHHWIGEQGGVVDVDLTLTGSDGDYEMVYLVTLATG